MHDYEHQLQKSFFEMMVWTEREKYPFVFAIPNGGHRNIIVAKKLKDEGVKAGVFDVFFAYPSDGYHGLWIEFKVKGNKLTEHQKEFKKTMEGVGYKCSVCYSLEEAERSIKSYLLEI